MRAQDVTDTLELALPASACDQLNVVHRPRLLGDNGFSRRPTSTSDAVKPSCCKEKGSNEVRSNDGTCNSIRPLHKITNQMSRSLS
jgi:hypothetical protein